MGESQGVGTGAAGFGGAAAGLEQQELQAWQQVLAGVAGAAGVAGLVSDETDISFR